MAQVKFLMADPEVKVINSPRQVIFIHGGDTADLAPLSDEHISKPQTLAGICQQGAETSIIQLVFDGGRPIALHAWRPVHSKYEVFFSPRPDGDVWVTDTVRNMIACTPPSDRNVSEEHTLDHLIFRRIPMNGCILQGWQRLGPGEFCKIDLTSREVEISQFDRLGAQLVYMPPNERLEALDSLFSEIMHPYNGKQGMASLFSGGVDSTLLYTYLSKETVSVTAMPDSLMPHEKETLDLATNLLGISPDYFPVSSDDYLDQLEVAIEGFGLPPELDQITFYTNLFNLPHSSFLSGTPADSLLGSYPTDGWSGLFMMAMVRFGGVNMARAFAPLIPARYRQRYSDMADWAEEFHHDLFHLDGTTALEDAFTSFPLLFRAFGKDKVLERLQNRLDQLIPTVDRSAPESDLYLQHMEMLHWMGFIAGGAALQERQYGLAFGKSVILPFTDRRLVDFTCSIPVKERYLTETRQAKPWLKKLLAKRLPGYPVFARKGTTQYPMPDFFAKGGPLEHAWERYNIFSPLKETVEQDFRAQWSDLNWNVLGYAIWQERVLNNGDLNLLPLTKTFSYALEATEAQRSALTAAK